MSDDYKEKLKDPRWQRKRLEIFQRDDWRCKRCGDTKSELNVHHKRYKRGYEPWEYADHYLETLCRPCHTGHHEEEKARVSNVMRVPQLSDFLDGGVCAQFLLPGEREQVYARWNDFTEKEAKRKEERAHAHTMGIY